MTSNEIKMFYSLINKDRQTYHDLAISVEDLLESCQFDFTLSYLMDNNEIARCTLTNGYYVTKEGRERFFSWLDGLENLTIREIRELISFPEDVNKTMSRFDKMVFINRFR